jgi:hypothetical protein
LSALSRRCAVREQFPFFLVSSRLVCIYLIGSLVASFISISYGFYSVELLERSVVSWLGVSLLQQTIPFLLPQKIFIYLLLTLGFTSDPTLLFASSQLEIFGSFVISNCQFFLPTWQVVSQSNCFRWTRKDQTTQRISSSLPSHQ